MASWLCIVGSELGDILSVFELGWAFYWHWTSSCAISARGRPGDLAGEQVGFVTRER